MEQNIFFALKSDSLDRFEQVKRSKIDSNTNTKIEPWFWFLIPKPNLFDLNDLKNGTTKYFGNSLKSMPYHP